MKNKRGFTLIELLIVIALLGALAVGLLATVDPFEQLKKGRDTANRNTAAEFYNAAIRYYAQRNAFPTGITSGLSAASLSSLVSSISDLANAGELKSDFSALAGAASLGRIYITVPSTDRIVVCNNPESKAFRNDLNAKYDQVGSERPSSECPLPTASDCYVCFK